MPTDTIQWIAKGRAHRIWQDVHTYVEQYTAEHQDQLTAPWFNRWYTIFRKANIGDENVQLQVAAFVITNSPTSTIHDCVQALFKFIPELSEHFDIIDVGKRNGNIKYKLRPYVNPNPPVTAINTTINTLATDNVEEWASWKTHLYIPQEGRSMYQLACQDYYEYQFQTSTPTKHATTSSTPKKPTSPPTPPRNEDQKDNTSFLSSLQSSADKLLTTFKKKCDDTTEHWLSYLTKASSRLVEGNIIDLQYESTQQTQLFKTTITNERQQQEKHYQNMKIKYQNEISDIYEAETKKFKENIERMCADFLLDIRSRTSKATATSTTTTSSSPPITSSHAKTFSSKSPYHPTSKPSPTYRSSYSTSSSVIDINDRRNIKFSYEGEEYELQDKDFIKLSPRLIAPRTEDDGLSLYSQLQRNALIYNILVTDIEEMSIWTMDPGSAPPTYPIPTTDSEFNHLAYQRGATALYTKLSTLDFSQVPLYKEFLEYERDTQDGYRVLYAILGVIHPKLVHRSKMDEPTLETTPNLFTYIRHYRNWLEFERVCKRSYNPIEQLTTILDSMEKESRFTKAVNNIRMQLHLHQSITKSAPGKPFPSNLLLEQLPYTIMNVYPSHERTTLFGTSNPSEDDTFPTINRLNRSPYKSSSTSSSNPNYKSARSTSLPPIQRPRVNRFCPACGNYGHDVKNGCDFTAQLIRSLDYLRKNPHAKKTILQHQFTHQGNRKKVLQSKTQISDKFHNKAASKNFKYGAKVKTLIDIMGETMDDVFATQFEDEATADDAIDSEMFDDLANDVDLDNKEDFYETSEHGDDEE